MDLLTKIDNGFSLSQRFANLSIRVQANKKDLEVLEFGSEFVLMSRSRYDEIVTTLKNYEHIKSDLQKIIGEI